MKKIIIIGSGVNGLSSAVKIAEYFYRQNVQTILVSEHESPDTTGDLSAGLWGPYLIGTTSEEKIVQWSKSSHDFFHEMWLGGLADHAGISMIPCYRLTTAPEGMNSPSWKDVVFGYTLLNTNQLDRMSREHRRQPVYTGGSSFVTFCCEPVKFLPYLMKRFLAAGGQFEKRKVHSLDEFVYADLIINCTGLGSKDLTNDNHFQVIRGQIARVKAQWMYEVVLQEDDVGNYIIPNIDSVVLGGTHQINDCNLKVSVADSDFIFQGTQNVNPGLYHSALINEAVGLRPGRTAVRLEKERRLGKPTVIHNAGHGGCGVTLCWGCGDDVLELTIEEISGKGAKL